MNKYKIPEIQIQYTSIPVTPKQAIVAIHVVN